MATDGKLFLDLTDEDLRKFRVRDAMDRLAEAEARQISGTRMIMDEAAGVGPLVGTPATGPLPDIAPTPPLRRTPLKPLAPLPKIAERERSDSQKAFEQMVIDTGLAGTPAGRALMAQSGGAAEAVFRQPRLASGLARQAFAGTPGNDIPSVTMEEALGDLQSEDGRVRQFLFKDLPESARAVREAPLAAVASAFRAIGRGFVGVPASELEGLAFLAEELNRLLPEGLEKHEGNPFSSEDNRVQAAARAMSAFAEEHLPPDPEFRDNFFAEVLPQGLGSAFGFLATIVGTKGLGKGVSAISKALGRGGKAAKGAAAAAKAARRADLALTAGTGALVSGGAAVREAESFGETDPANMRRVFYGNTMLGTTEVFGVGSTIRRTLAGAGSRSFRALATNVVTEALEEAAQEGIQSIGGNAIAARTFDKGRPLMEDFIEGTAAGGAVGGFFSLLMNGAMRMRRTFDPKTASPQEIVDAIIADSENDLAIPPHVIATELGTIGDADENLFEGLSAEVLEQTRVFLESAPPEAFARSRERLAEVTPLPGPGEQVVPEEPALAPSAPGAANVLDAIAAAAREAGAATSGQAVADLQAVRTEGEVPVTLKGGRFSTAEVKRLNRSLPSVTFNEDPNVRGALTATLPNGRVLQIVPVDVIRPSDLPGGREAALARIAQRSGVTPEQAQATLADLDERRGVAGVTLTQRASGVRVSLTGVDGDSRTELQGDQVVLLAGRRPDGTALTSGTSLAERDALARTIRETIPHELFHVVELNFLTDAEISTLEREIGDQEARADFYARLITRRETHPILSKIAEFFTKLADTFLPGRAGAASRKIARRVAAPAPIAGRVPGQVDITEREEVTGPIFQLPEEEIISPEARREAARPKPSEVFGRPELAIPAETPAAREFISGVDEIRKELGIPQRRGDAEVAAEATKRLKTDYEGQRQKILDDAAAGKGVTSDVEAVMVNRIVANEVAQSLAQNNESAFLDAGRMVDAMRRGRTETARAFRQFRDKFESPEQRWANAVAMAILEPNAGLKRELAKAGDDLAARERILSRAAADNLRIVEKIKEIGIDPADLTPANLARPGGTEDARKAINIIVAEKKSWGDAIYEYWISSLLSGPQTHIANITGNSLNLVWDFTAQRLTEAFVNFMTPAGLKSVRSARFSDFPKIIQSILPGLSMGATNALKSWRAETAIFEEEVFGRAGTDKLELERRGPAIAGRKGKIIRTPLRALVAADEFFKALVARLQVGIEAERIAELEGLEGDARAVRANELMQEIGSEAWEAAFERSLLLTFQNQPGELVQAIMDVRNKKGIVGLLKFLIPFVRTPANIFKIGIKKSPLGTLALAHNVGRVIIEKSLGARAIAEQTARINDIIEDLASDPGGRSPEQKQLLRRLNRKGIKNREVTRAALASPETRARVETAMRQLIPGPSETFYTKHEFNQQLAEQILAWGAVLVLLPMVVGDDDEEPVITGTSPFRLSGRGERSVVNAELPPLSVRIGDTWVSYSRVEPAAVSVGLTIDLIQEFLDVKGGKDPGTALGELIAHVTGQLQDKTFLSGISDFMQMLEDPSRNASRFGTNFAVSWIPNIYRQTGRGLDPAVREGRIAGVTAASKTVGPSYGRELLRQTGRKAAALPGFQGEIKIDHWGQEITKPGFNQSRSEVALTDWLFRMLSPVQLRGAAGDRDEFATELDLMVLRYNDQNPERQWWPGMPSATITRDGVREVLNQKDYSDLLTEAGRGALDLILNEIESPSGDFDEFDFENPTENNMELIQKFRNQAAREARDRLFPK